MLSTKAVHSQGWLQWLLSTTDKVATTTTSAAKLHGTWTGFLLCMQGSSLGEFYIGFLRKIVCSRLYLEKVKKLYIKTYTLKSLKVLYKETASPCILRYANLASKGKSISEPHRTAYYLLPFSCTEIPKMLTGS